MRISRNLILGCMLILFASATANVGANSAQWVGSQSNDWNNPLNWNPNTIPNGPTDLATFFFSVPDALITANTEVNEIILNGSDAQIRNSIVTSGVE